MASGVRRRTVRGDCGDRDGTAFHIASEYHSGNICLALRCKSIAFGETPMTQSLYHVGKHYATMHKDQPARSAVPTGFVGAGASIVSRAAI